uniref:Chromobox 3 n=1 Tax=Aceria tosichella TaxID=561515 RepID=A0A6G1SMF7_9ACAR
MVMDMEVQEEEEEGNGKGEEEEEEEYIVEAIREWRYDATDRRKEFLIKWNGYPEEDNTWEPEENLNCEHILQEFKASLQGDDLRCFNHPDPDGLTGFQRHAPFDKCIGADGPHESDEEESSGKPPEDRQKFYCLLRFTDSEYAEEVSLTEFFKNEPEAAFKFCEQRLLAK